MCFPQCNDKMGIGETFPFQKGEIGKKKGVSGLKQVQDLARQIPLDLKTEE